MGGEGRSGDKRGREGRRGGGVGGGIKREVLEGGLNKK